MITLEIKDIVLPSSEFDIYEKSIRFNQNDEIRFAGLRYSDGKDVNCILYPDGNLTVLEDETAGIVTLYYPIN